MFAILHLNEEAPAIGCGRRIVFVERCGRKWVWIRCPRTLRTAKLKRRDFDAAFMAPAFVPVHRLRRRVRSFLRATGQSQTKAIRNMLEKGNTS